MTQDCPDCQSYSDLLDELAFQTAIRINGVEDIHLAVHAISQALHARMMDCFANVEFENRLTQ